MTHSRVSSTLPRIGLVTGDAMRILGLQAILGDGQVYDVLQMSGAEALRSHVAVVVIDSTTTEDTFELIHAFLESRPGVGVLVLGVETDPDYIERVIAAGSRGYLNHAANEGEVRMAIEVVLDGSIWAPRKVLAHLLQSSRKSKGELGHQQVTFTRREREVLKLLVLGQPNREMATELGVDEGTIKAHMGRIMRKAGVDNRTALSMRAIERNWI